MPWLIFKEAFEFADIREAPPQLRLAWVLSFIVFFFSPLVMVIATSQLRAVENLGKFVCEKKHDHITRAIDGCDVSDDLRMPTEDEMHHVHQAVDIGWPIILFSSISLMMGFGGMLSDKKSFIGKRSLNKPALTDPERKQLVGLKSVDGKSRIPRGAQIVNSLGEQVPVHMIGEVTSNCYSPNLKEFIGLGIVKRGPERHGDRVWAVSPLTKQQVEVEICSPHMYDPEGERLRG